MMIKSTKILTQKDIEKALELSVTYKTSLESVLVMLSEGNSYSVVESKLAIDNLMCPNCLEKLTVTTDEVGYYGYCETIAFCSICGFC